MSENSSTPFFFQPSRQSPVAILLILARLIRSLIGQFWPVLLLLLLRRRSANSSQFWVWVGIGITILSVIRSLVTYFRTRFYIHEDEFILEKGGFTRRRLSVPLDKIQTITFQQTFLHRLFNVVSIEMDTTGAKGSEINLNALDEEKARILRDYLLRWKKENANAAPNLEAAPPAPEVELLKIDLAALLRIGLSQNHLRSAGILFGLLASFAREIQPILGKSTYKYLEEEWGLTFNFFWTFALWIIVFFLLVSVIATLALTIVRFYNLRFVQTGEGFRLEAGLFTRREQAAYLPKIQFLRWSSNPLQRFWGMYNLRFYQAAGQQLRGKQTLQVPGSYLHQIAAVQTAYFPGHDQVQWDWYRPHRLYFHQRLFILGLLPLLGLIVKTSFDFNWFWFMITLLWLPATAWWQWNLLMRKHYGLCQQGLWVKSGFFTQSQILLQWTNVQGIELKQSRLEKRFGVADLTFYTASGEVEIESLPLDMINSLRDYVLAKIEVGVEKVEGG
ncbi:MAG: PH domain-containing protein [Haliscomenobacter sp.]|uniref:PH domain-containing protein n=1 Tax=Haliscomenobacter sp. TaxID=2717303 RepID=UPI0029B3D762|nr:PH domain-containing protein [Haliscomenobacter sp.]MDX2068781.1 PH domain-containing protein [Haliscomenobacter sp.]